LNKGRESAVSSLGKERKREKEEEREEEKETRIFIKKKKKGKKKPATRELHSFRSLSLLSDDAVDLLGLKVRSRDGVGAVAPGSKRRSARNETASSMVFK